MKPIKCVQIVQFYKNNEKDTSSNTHDGLCKDNEKIYIEHEEKFFIQKTGETDYAILYDVSYSEVSKIDNKNEIEEKQEEIENEILNKVLRENIIKVRECKNELNKSG